MPDRRAADPAGSLPDVTVVVPTRNAARTLAACLESLQAQTYPCHAVVVDNGSTDGATAIAAEDGIDLDYAERDTILRTRGRLGRHRVWSAPVPPTITFPRARTYIIVERKSSTLDDVRVSIETRFYATDLTAPAGCRDMPQNGPSRGEKTYSLGAQDAFRDSPPDDCKRIIENGLHWVREVTFGEDLSQVHTGTLPRVVATLRNLAIGIIRHTTSRTVNIAAATRQLARQPDITLDLL